MKMKNETAALIDACKKLRTWMGPTFTSQLSDDHPVFLIINALNQIERAENEDLSQG